MSNHPIVNQISPSPHRHGYQTEGTELQGKRSLLNCPLALLVGSQEGLALPGFFFQSHSEDASCSIPGTAEKGQEAAPGAAGREQQPSPTHSVRTQEFSPQRKRTWPSGAPLCLHFFPPECPIRSFRDGQGFSAPYWPSIFGWNLSPLVGLPRPALRGEPPASPHQGGSGLRGLQKLAATSARGGFSSGPARWSRHRSFRQGPWALAS